MDPQELQELIKDMPFAAEVKQEISARQQAGAPAEEILEMIANRLDEVEKNLMESTPEGAAAYKQAMQEYADEVSVATKEFEQEMNELEAAAKAAEQQINLDVDKARLQELTEERHSI